MKLISLIIAITTLYFTTSPKPPEQAKISATVGQQEQMVTVTMPARYWGVVIQGLQELPAKYSNQVSDSIVSQYNRQMIKK